MAGAAPEWRNCAGAVADLDGAVPLRALKHRIQSSVEPPSWIKFLPPQVARGFCSPSDDSRGAAQLDQDGQAGAFLMLAPCAIKSPSSAPTTAPPTPSTGATLGATLGELGGCRSGAIARPRLADAVLPARASHIVGAGRPPGAARGSVASVASAVPPAVARILGSVWRLSREADGCRQVQTAFEECQDEENKSLLMDEIRGHVWEGLRCPHANHVLQKCVLISRPEASQFIIDELVGGGGAGTGVTQAARHRFGCRVVERLIERCEAHQLQGLIAELLPDTLGLSTHQFGNYVVQHVLQYGSPEQQRLVSAHLGDALHVVGSDCHGCAVLAKALMHGSKDMRSALARKISNSEGLTPLMARTRHGHVAVKLTLQLLEDFPDAMMRVRRELEANMHLFRNSRYGRFVAQALAQVPVPRSASPIGAAGGMVLSGYAAEQQKPAHIDTDSTLQRVQEATLGGA